MVYAELRPVAFSPSARFHENMPERAATVTPVFDERRQR